ncbi:MAG: NAD(P)-dependent oxidoreductase [Fimbriimonadaceae bacterium]|nr:NAD(P)-dependent oxidoreductase [Alphaproteobacteria bacterium]
MAKFNRLLLTGAAGDLGSQLRDKIKHLTAILRVSDREDLGKARPDEEAVRCDLADMADVMALTKDVDAIIHMGGISRENTFDNVLQSNIVGIYNLYESSRKNGVKRIIFASSNHAIGFYPRNETIDSNVRHRPDTLYGLSKSFGENLAQYYFDKFGIETVSLRIGSCFPEPADRRMLATWLSYRDMVHLVERALIVPKTGHTIIYGMSDNDELFWDNSKASALGYRPKDNAEKYREKVEAATDEPDPADPAIVFCGGSYAAGGHFED